MATDVSLSTGIRASLLSLQDTTDNINTIQYRLSTGKKVNSALDDPLKFFVAQSFTQRSSALQTRLDAVNLAVQSLQAVSSSIDSITKLAQQAQGILQQAQSSTDQTVRANAGKQFEQIKSQINSLVSDASFNGRNLINGGKAGTYNALYDLRVSFNEADSTQLDIKAVNLRATGVGQATGGDAANQETQFAIDRSAAATGYTTANANADTDLAADVSALSSYISNLQGAATTFGTNLSILQTRQSSIKQQVLSLNGGADSLTLADINEEGAKLTTLQTRQSLGVTALALTSQSDKAILKLFGG